MKLPAELEEALREFEEAAFAGIGRTDLRNLIVVALEDAEDAARREAYEEGYRAGREGGLDDGFTQGVRYGATDPSTVLSEPGWWV